MRNKVEYSPSRANSVMQSYSKMVHKGAETDDDCLLLYHHLNRRKFSSKLLLTLLIAHLENPRLSLYCSHFKMVRTRLQSSITKNRTRLLPRHEIEKKVPFGMKTVAASSIQLPSRHLPARVLSSQAKARTTRGDKRVRQPLRFWHLPTDAAERVFQALIPQSGFISLIHFLDYQGLTTLASLSRSARTSLVRAISRRVRSIECCIPHTLIPFSVARYVPGIRSMWDTFDFLIEYANSCIEEISYSSMGVKVSTEQRKQTVYKIAKYCKNLQTLKCHDHRDDAETFLVKIVLHEHSSLKRLVIFNPGQKTMTALGMSKGLKNLESLEFHAVEKDGIAALRYFLRLLDKDNCLESIKFIVSWEVDGSHGHDILPLNIEDFAFDLDEASGKLSKTKRITLVIPDGSANCYNWLLAILTNIQQKLILDVAVSETSTSTAIPVGKMLLGQWPFHILF